MPTARELLEQADALMRRHRGSAPEPPAPRAPSPVVSPRPIQHEPIAPSVARTALPVDPAESPLIDPQREPAPLLPNVPTPSEVASPAPVTAAPTPALPTEPGPDIPLLTDTVPGGEVIDDDVPLLTDAVEEIDFPPVAADVDDDSGLWLDTEQGEAGVAAGGEAPPRSDQAAPERRDPLGLDQPAPGFELSAEFQRAPSGSADDGTFGEIPQSEIVTELRETDDRVGPQEQTQPDIAMPELAQAQPVLAERAEAIGDASQTLRAIDEIEPVAEAIAAGEPTGTIEAAEEIAVTGSAGEAIPEFEVGVDLTQQPEPQIVLAAPPLAPLDDARIREIAEEISMQVLQRIDIFADTGLRSQLGERLKPAIDRAAADLVTEINQHVGELLRSFVADAVEREIERWRERQS